MQISLSDHFTFKRLIRFVMPSVIMMIVTSLYGIVDGIFVSNIVGKKCLCCCKPCNANSYGTWFLSDFWSEQAEVLLLPNTR